MDQKQIQDLLKIIRKIKTPDEKVFLVGGAVRDRFLNLPIHDLDFAVQNDPELLAKKLANYLKANFYVLDDLRNTARVVMNSNSEPTITFDFARLRGNSLLEDLKSRDFTVNAMTIDLDRPTDLLDPLNGKGSLEGHQLQLCSKTAFNDDPIRVLRAVRFSVKYHLSLDPMLMKSIKKSGPLVMNTSKERQRDELFQILALDQADEGIHLLDGFGLIDLLFPVISPLKEILLNSPAKGTVWNHTEKVIIGLHKITGWLDNPSPSNKVQDPNGEIFITYLKRFLPALREYISGSIVADRSRISLLAFAALLHDAGVKTCQSTDWNGSTQAYCIEKVSADMALEIAAGFKLGKKEQELIHLVIKNHSVPNNLQKSIYPLDKRTIYRFFQATQEAGIGVCLLSLADFLAINEITISPEQWKHQLGTVKALFHAWWSEQTETVNITPLLNGDDLSRVFYIKEGPRVGTLLDSLKEEQASGAIKTRAKAIAFIKRCIESGIEKK